MEGIRAEAVGHLPPCDPVSCVIVAFHDAASLRSLLASMRHPCLRAVVVNVEVDPDVERVACEARATHIPLDGNPGYASAVNRGVAACPEGAVVFMNDDVRADASAIFSLASAVQAGHADVAVPAVRTADGRIEGTIAALPTPLSLLLEWALLPDRPPALSRFSHRIQKWRRPAAPARIDAAAAIVVATTTALLRAEPLPEQYFLYWEESEWFWRLHRRRAVVQYRPDAVVCHDGGRGDVRVDKSRLLARNAVRCLRRTHGRAAAALGLPVVVAWNARLAVVAALRAGRQPRAGHDAVLRARLAGLRAAVGAYAEVARPS